MQYSAPPVTPEKTLIKSLGTCRIDNPMRGRGGFQGGGEYCVDDETRVRVDGFLSPGDGQAPLAGFERSGPRRQIYFDPTKLKAAVVACGGMCPGMNTLVRSIVFQLHYMYGVSNIVGVRFGLQGFIPRYGHELLELTPEVVQNVHGRGGCFLGLSRGAQPVDEVVDALERLNIGLLFMIGGDGTLRASKAIVEEIDQRRLKMGVVAIPKTIDNDICFVDRTFGFQTAVEAATHAILGAHNEAVGADNGIGLVKLMGRLSGFVAAHAPWPSEVNFCLIRGGSSSWTDPRAPAELEAPGEATPRGDRGGRGAGQKRFSARPGARPLGQPQAGRHRHLPQGPHRPPLPGTQEGNRAQVHRSLLSHTLGAGQPQRPHLRGLSGARGGARRHGRQDRPHGVHVEQPLCPRAHRAGHRAPVHGGPGGGLWRAVREATGQSRLINQE